MGIDGGLPRRLRPQVRTRAHLPHIERAGTDRVRYVRGRLSLITRTVITFLDAHDRSLGLSFIPWRAERVRAGLERHGWPVDLAHFGLTGRSDDDRDSRPEH